MIVPTVELEVIGSKRRQKITALIDTGFSGYLCLPTDLAKNLGLELIGQEEVQLADGRWVNRLVFDGKVRFLGQTQKVSILLADGTTAQIGTLLLGDCRLTIDFPGNRLDVTRVPLD